MNFNYKSFDSVVIRTPVNSYLLIDNLEELRENAFFKEAIYFGSRNLFDEFDSKKGEVKQSAKVSLLNYWNRSCFRPIPFGSFSAIGIVPLSESETKIILKQPEQHTKKIRLDFQCLQFIVDKCHESDTALMQLKIFPNQSIITNENQIRYFFTKRNEKKETYERISVVKTRLLTFILKTAKSGLDVKTLVTHIANREKITEEDAFVFVKELIDSQLLTTELNLNICGRNPLTVLVEKTMNIVDLKTEHLFLKEIDKILSSGICDLVTSKRLEDQIKDLFPATEKCKSIFQVDLFSSFDVRNINRNLINRVVEEITPLLALRRTHSVKVMDDFKSRFKAKYGNTYVPLLEALDPDIGVGFPDKELIPDLSSPLLKDIHGNQSSKESDKVYQFDSIQEFVLRRFIEARDAGKTEIKLEDHHLKELELLVTDKELPSSLYIAGKLYKKDGNLDLNNFSFSLDLISGPSAANLLSRFAYGDMNIQKLVSKIIDKEDKEAAPYMVAEVVHYPGESRIGNVLFRPSFRDHEILCLGETEDSTCKVKMDDIMVTFVKDKLILKSKKHGKRIIPKSTNAHNFSISTFPLYSFLCYAQIYDSSFANVWDWGVLENLEFLPRVTYKNIILRKARWTISNKISKDKLTIEYLKSHFQSRQIPSNILATIRGDQEFFIDLKSDESVKMLIGLLRSHKKIILKEILETEENAIVKDPSGAPIINQIVIPMYKDEDPYERGTNISPELNFHIKPHKFGVNEEWSYYKIFGNIIQLQDFLLGRLYSFTKVNKGLQYFFVRYREDGKEHLRLRFKFKDIAIREKFTELVNYIMKKGEISDFCIYPYEREDNRYLPALIEYAEHLFCCDSKFVVKFMTNFEDDHLTKMVLVIASIDRYLDDFDLTLQEKYEYSKRIATKFYEEFDGNKKMLLEINEKYRFIKAALEGLSKHRPKDRLIVKFERYLKARSIESATSIKKIQDYYADQSDRKKYIEDLLPSYIHMNINRLYPMGQRKHEMLIYHFLERFYTSCLAIQKRNLKYG